MHTHIFSCIFQACWWDNFQESEPSSRIFGSHDGKRSVAGNHPSREDSGRLDRWWTIQMDLLFFYGDTPAFIKIPTCQIVTWDDKTRLLKQVVGRSSYLSELLNDHAMRAWLQWSLRKFWAVPRYPQSKTLMVPIKNEHFSWPDFFLFIWVWSKMFEECFVRHQDVYCSCAGQY
jgi:hypothetical protein